MLMILEAFGIACLATVVFGTVTFIIVTFWLNLLDSSFKKIITGAFVIDWIETMREIFTLKGYIGLILLCGIIFTFPCLESMKKVELEKEGKCTCSCKVCQKIAEDLAKFNASKTNDVAKAMQN